ncbi:MAG: HAD family hydrolase [Microthrixaceae bacterium]
MAPATATGTTGGPVIVWDLGNVLIPWDRHGAMLAATGDDDTAVRLAEEVFTLEVNELLDRGSPLEDIRAEVELSSPGHGWVVDAYVEHFRESLGPVIQGSANLLDELIEAGRRCVGLSNWGEITFRGIPEAYPAIQKLEGIVISGEVGVTKPNEEIFRHAEQRFGFAPSEALFIDDSPKNIEGARRCGWDAIHFAGAPQLRSELVSREILPQP